MNNVLHDNWVTRCNPLTKLTMIPCFGLAATIFPNFWLGLGLLVIVLVLAAIAGLFFKIFRLMLTFGIPISLMLFVIQGLYSPKNKTYIVDLGFAKLGTEGLFYGIKLLVTLLVFLGTFYLFSKTIYSRRLSATLVSHGVNPRLIYLLLASLKIVPEMQHQIKIVKQAQETRGLRTTGSLFSRFKAFVPLIGPVILSSLINAQERGMALELKGLGIVDVKVTSLVESQDTPQDRLIRKGLWLFLGVTIIVVILLRMNS
ncbi:energy-coupling factor transporter transmembrane component T [Latilactobacillus curvatus]|uniref:energy-coupling factor transporter transmembrane component T n=1 Tax=Latilactobacillus curvatus TaxID=28038 RepID=UPI000FECBA3E|nr:energy-coupling factor transporter transmembrane component T [Latilactobacillus curvatus]QAR34631.1 energy-coupling factor transporter transmembrane protein EcfT [Latilactobacillus curvatus]